MDDLLDTLDVLTNMRTELDRTIVQAQLGRAVYIYPWMTEFMKWVDEMRKEKIIP